MTQLLRTREMLVPLLIMSFAMAAQQFSGINAGNITPFSILKILIHRTTTKTRSLVLQQRHPRKEPSLVSSLRLSPHHCRKCSNDVPPNLPY